jgi:hypothetical protein
MEEPDEISLFPITAWQIEAIPAINGIRFCPDFLTGPLQHIDDADKGRNYVLSPQQAIFLIQGLSTALEKLQSAEFQPVPGQKH